MANGKRLIDVDVAEKSIRTSASLLRSNIGCGYDKGAADALSSVADMLKTMPTVDAVEVVHGRWIRKGNEMKCSKCKFIYYSNHDDFNYCPNCGAKMDGGAEDA